MLQPFGALPPPQRLAKRVSGAAHFTGRNFRGRSLCEEPVLWQSSLQISNPVHAVISLQGCDLSVTFTLPQSTRAWFDSLKKKLKVTTSPNLLCEWWEILPGRHIEIVSTALDNLTIKGLHNINRSSYLIFVIFFTRTKFLKNKIYTEIYSVNCQFFALNL